MKEMKIKTIKGENQEKTIKGIQAMNLASDWYKCLRCGYTAHMKAYGNHPRCPECGGLMERQ